MQRERHPKFQLRFSVPSHFDYCHPKFQVRFPLLREVGRGSTPNLCLGLGINGDMERYITVGYRLM